VPVTPNTTGNEATPDVVVAKMFRVALPTVMNAWSRLDQAHFGGVHRRLHLVRAGADEVDRGRAGG